MRIVEAWIVLSACALPAQLHNGTDWDYTRSWSQCEDSIRGLSVSYRLTRHSPLGQEAFVRCWGGGAQLFTSSRVEVVLNGARWFRSRVDVIPEGEARVAESSRTSAFDGAHLYLGSGRAPHLIVFDKRRRWATFRRGNQLMRDGYLESIGIHAPVELGALGSQPEWTVLGWLAERKSHLVRWTARTDETGMETIVSRIEGPQRITWHLDLSRPGVVLQRDRYENGALLYRIRNSRFVTFADTHLPTRCQWTWFGWQSRIQVCSGSAPVQ